MQEALNLKMKYRESFHPFAPSVLRDKVSDYFEKDGDSPYMLLFADVVSHRRIEISEAENTLFGIDKLNLPRSDKTAVTHVDYSAPVQTGYRGTNPGSHALISAFRDLTGCSAVITSSVNVRGEPIVCTPEEVFHCFMGTDVKISVVGNCLCRKENQGLVLQLDHKGRFEYD